ncbi:hypothetical protein TNCT_732381 [Trichonephila clavata]|uniref:Uncharacterized protein n=1 Tax=Trichonephila clavata TaxID=2740835 RepID=A0A8X6HT29_TRICU|nr:hypothetical protein TNCT_732381 [Trichonephila clavata]
MLLEIQHAISCRLWETDRMVSSCPLHPLHSRSGTDLVKMIRYRHVVQRLYRQQQYVVEHCLVRKVVETEISGMRLQLVADLRMSKVI